MDSFLVIGDPHIKVNNIEDINIFLLKLKGLLDKKGYKYIIILGDVLDSHEKLHIVPLNKAYEMVKMCREYAKTFILVGNHDMVNNQVFLTPDHWMNGMKEWNNVVIVDTVIEFKTELHTYTFCPYVPNGRFEEALKDSNFLQSKIIFCHQEFKGCKMGAITSIDGDNWNVDYPQIVSGHIHSNQSPQKNIYYIGSALQNAFGESEKNVVCLVKVDKNNCNFEEIDFGMKRKKIIYAKIEDFDTIDNEQLNEKTKVSFSGDVEEFKSFKKTSKYKEIIKSGAKIVHKMTRKETENQKRVNQLLRSSEAESNKTSIVGSADSRVREANDYNVNDNEFLSVLNKLVSLKNNNQLRIVYEKVVNNNVLDEINFL
jgi:DNA repair exonuclease SbcCD nuclease subunit